MVIIAPMGTQIILLYDARISNGLSFTLINSTKFYKLKIVIFQEELDRWSNNYIDVNALVKKLLDAERANRKLREEISGNYYFISAVCNLAKEFCKVCKVKEWAGQ